MRKLIFVLLAAFCPSARADGPQPPLAAPPAQGAPVPPKSVFCATARGAAVNKELGAASEDTFLLETGADGTWRAMLTSFSIITKRMETDTVTGLKCHFTADPRLFGCERAYPASSLKKVMATRVIKKGVWENGYPINEDWIDLFLYDSESKTISKGRFNNPDRECHAAD